MKNSGPTEYTSASDRPIIGLTVSPPEGGSPFYNLNPEYSNTVWRAGGDPLAIPLIPEPDYVDRMIHIVHGLILIGSAYDIDPARYGQSPGGSLKSPVPERDKLDSLLLQRAFRMQMPVLGICHGLQAINVFLGGTLIQDLTTKVPNALQHRTRSATGEYAHEIELVPQSVLNPSDRTRSVKVNSAHDQAVDQLGKGLRIIARAPDGITEAVEMEDSSHHFVLGVQWHPERLAGSDEFSFNVIKNTIGAAADWKRADPA
ncbi:gamma-glutamyl-gamma-aminobutyrate hydrolase family protein [Candidatus Neomarinimicrobiota bacterium]